MILYVIYFRTMVDSPEVTIECVTTSSLIARQAIEKAKQKEKEWMADEDEDSGNWAEACIRAFDVPGVKPGDTIHLLVHTEWYESVTTNIYPFISEEGAESLLSLMRSDYRTQFPDITPFDEDETFEESMHLEDPSVAIDVYFEIVDSQIQ